MRKRLGRKKRGLKNVSARANDESRAPVILKNKGKNDSDSKSDKGSGKGSEKGSEKSNGAFYNLGPALAMPNLKSERGGSSKNLEEGEGSSKASAGTGEDVARGAAAGAETRSEKISPLPNVSGSGSPKFGDGEANSVSLSGLTQGDFDGGSYATENVSVSAGEGCGSCSDADPCVRAQGTLVATYGMSTTVTLPSVNDFPDLTPCQRVVVQNAIDTVLAPHEQQHVDAFNQYRGVVRTRFDVTLCRSAFDSTMESMFDSQEAVRHSSAQAASDALDPFNFTVDIDCEEPTEVPGDSSAEAEVPVEGTEEIEESSVDLSNEYSGDVDASTKPNSETVF